MSLRLHHVVTASTAMSLRPDHAFAMTMMRRYQARNTFLVTTHNTLRRLARGAPRASHALRTCGINMGATLATAP